MDKPDQKKYKDIAVAVVKDSHGKVLIVKRKNKHESIDGSHLSWTFPGKSFTTAESANGAVERFVLDETGYEIKAHGKISDRKYHPFGLHLVYLDAELKNQDQVREPVHQKVEEVAWVNPGEITSYITTNLDHGLKEYLGI